MQAELDFIAQHKSEDLASLALSLSKRNDLDKDFILRQIQGWQKARQKLPSWAAEDQILYPPAISMEQCSSERTARFKAHWFAGKRLVDLTGGFGVDSYYFSKSFEQVHYVEPFLPLFKVVQHNFQLLHADNIVLHQQSAEDFIEAQKDQDFSLCYIDPSRRNQGRKVFLLADCQPNIVALAEKIFAFCPKIVVKTSPLLDIKQSIRELGSVAEVHVLDWHQECKELLFVMQRGYAGQVRIYAHHLLAQNQEESFSFDWEAEAHAKPTYSDPLRYIYEPNAAILKAGAFNSIAKAYAVQKLAPNSHLYTSEELMEDFPGRKFLVHQQLPYQAKAFKKLGIKKANISCRNFKASVEQIRKKLKIQPGGDQYIFATTLQNYKAQLLICQKLY